MSKKITYFTIEKDASIREIGEIPEAPLSVFGPEWQARYEQGAELAIVSAPAIIDPKNQQQVVKRLNTFSYKGTRYDLRPLPGNANLLIGVVDSGIPVFEFNRDGKAKELKTEAAKKQQNLRTQFVSRMILSRWFPGVEIAQFCVPTTLNQEEKITVENAMARFTWEGKEWSLFGASGSAKDGHFMATTREFLPKLQKVYQYWPECSISYAGISVSQCDKALIRVPARVKIVKDHELGTNDCRGWIVKRLVREMNLPHGLTIQHRVALVAVDANAKGEFKEMSEKVANHPAVNADIVLPESSIKPSRPDLVGKTLDTDVVIGVREVSRADIDFEGSYTILQHASWEVIEQEIIANCKHIMDVLKSGIDDATCEERESMLKKIGAANGNDGYFRIAEACLSADRVGFMSRHPYIHRNNRRLLAKFAYKMLTGGGMSMPSRTLIDDGFLFVENGKLFHGSDWLPKDRCITDMDGDRNLCVRFPIRMIEDLLPMRKLTEEQGLAILTSRGLSTEGAKKVWDDQLMIYGTYTLNAERAKDFGGDYDGDCVAVITSAAYPKFVEYRFGVVDRPQPQKEKKKRKQTLWFNIHALAFKAMGNLVGKITNLMSSSMAFGRPDLAFELVKELQAEIDSLKHDSHADPKVIEEIEKLAGKANWLDIDKKCNSLDDKQLPKKVEPLSDSDVIARMYNVLRPLLDEMIGEEAPLSDYAGLFTGLCGDEKITMAMMAECRTIAKFWGKKTGEVSSWLGKVTKAAVDAKTAARASKRNGASKEEREELWDAARSAEANLEEAKVKFRWMNAQVRQAVQAWGFGKSSCSIAESERMKAMAWAAALNRVLCDKAAYYQGKQQEQGGANEKVFLPSSGSVLFHAFPQQFADAVAAQTRGEKVLVDSWGEDWSVQIDRETSSLWKVSPQSRKVLFRCDQVKVQTKDGGERNEPKWTWVDRDYLLSALSNVVSDGAEVDVELDLATL